MWSWLIPILSLVVVCVIALVISIAWRSRALYLRVGSFDIAWRHSHGKWREGVVTFGAHHLAVYKPISLSRRPAYSITRSELNIESSRDYAPQPGSCLVELRIGENTVEVVMKADAYAGVISWLDAAGPREEPSVL